MISKEEFLKYEKCRLSGKTNMFLITRVMALTGLIKEQVLDCMQNYGKYRGMYL